MFTSPVYSPASFMYMYSYFFIKFSHHPAIKICPFVDPGVFYIYCILAVKSRGLLTMSLYSLAMLHFLPSHILVAFFHLPVFSTGAYAFLLMLMPLPQPASDLTPYFHNGLYVLCVHSQPEGIVSSYFQGFKCCDHNYTFGETLLV